MEDHNGLQLPFYARLSMVLLSTLIILLLLYVGKSIFIPLFFSVLIAFMLLPITKWLERRGISRPLGAICAILLFIALVGGLFYFLGQQVADFSRTLPQLGVRLMAWLQQLQTWITVHYHDDATNQIAYVQKNAAGIATSATAVAQAVLVTLGGFAILTIFVFLFTFFILTHRALLRKFIMSLFASRYQQRVSEVMTDTRLLANSYVLGLLIEMIIVAVLNCIVFFLFGVKYALLLGVLAAVLNIIPYLGIYTAAAISDDHEDLSKKTGGKVKKAGLIGPALR